MVERWIDLNQENKKEFQEFKRIWKLSNAAVSSQDIELDADSEWSRLGTQMDKTHPLSDKKSDRGGYNSFRSSSIHSGTQKFIRLAAIFLIAGFMGLFAYQNLYQPESEEQEPVLREFRTDNGQRANVTLADGTEVMLNADSKIELPTEFASDVREVHLDGEAYFKVSKNIDKPFLVNSNQSQVRVLGTSFSVRSYPEDQQVQVVVEEGRVSFGNGDEEDDQQTILERNELGAYDISTSTVAKQKVEDMELYLSWRNGYLKFQETKMKDVAKALERRYDVEISFINSDIEQLSLTAYLKSRSLRNVLDVIAASLEITYQLNENKVSFMHE